MFKMKQNPEMIIFQSQIQSAMQDLMPWDTLISLMNNLCTNFEKAKDINFVLLDELKVHKKCAPNDVEFKATSQF